MLRFLTTPSLRNLHPPEDGPKSQSDIWWSDCLSHVTTYIKQWTRPKNEKQKQIQTDLGKESSQKAWIYMIWNNVCPVKRFLAGFNSPLLLRFFNNSITSKPPSARGRTQISERYLVKRLSFPCNHGQEKMNQIQKWKTKTDPNKPRKGVNAKDLDTYDLKQCLSGEVFSPRV